MTSAPTTLLPCDHCGALTAGTYGEEPCCASCAVALIDVARAEGFVTEAARDILALLAENGEGAAPGSVHRAAQWGDWRPHGTTEGNAWLWGAAVAYRAHLLLTVGDDGTDTADWLEDDVAALVARGWDVDSASHYLAALRG